MTPETPLCSRVIVARNVDVAQLAGKVPDKICEPYVNLIASAFVMFGTVPLRASAFTTRVRSSDDSEDGRVPDTPF